MRGTLLTLLLMLLLPGVVLSAAVVGIMAYFLARPPRMTDGKAAWLLKRLSPGDLNLPFEELRLTVRDERNRPLDIAAWWIPCAASTKCAVLLHGYADAKVGAIAWAPVWHALGYHLLVPDLRAHGESGGTCCTGGFFERHDVSQVIDLMRERKPNAMRQVVLFGASSGAAVAAAVAAQRDDIAAVVMESPYADFRHAALAHMNQLGLPGRVFQVLAVRLAEWATGARYDDVRPVDLIRRADCPLLVIESGRDALVSAEDRAAIEAAVDGRRPTAGAAELWRVEGAEHLLALAADPEAYRDRLQRFLAYQANDDRRYAGSRSNREYSGELGGGP